MRISILQYFVVFITWKLLGTAFLALLVLVICSLPLTESASGAVVFFVLWGSILLNKIIPSSSTLVMLRDCSIYQIISPEYWFTGLRSYCIGMGSQIMVISGIVLPLFCMALFGLIFLISGSYIYYSGLRKSTASEKSRQVSFFSFGKSLWWNEGYFLALQKKLLFAAAGICILFGAAVCDYDPVYNETVKFERQVVTLLNEKPFEEAHAWLLDKQAEIEDLENQVILMGQQLEEGLISKEQYNGICTLLSNQLRIKPVIQEMIAQEEDMIKCREETGIQPKYEYTSLSGQLYDESGWEQRNWIAVFIGCFVVFCAMTVFPDDRSKGIHKVLGSTPGGVRGVLSRVIWLSVMTFFLSVVMHLLWLSSLHKQYTLVGFNTPAQSWAVYRSLGLKMTVGQAVLLEICGQSLKWTLAGAAGIWISMYFANTAWAELTGLVLLVIPPVIHILGLSWFRRLPHIRSIIYGEMNVLSGMQGILWILIFGVILLIGLEKETKRWMEA